MSLLKFELKEDHIKLLKHLKWSLTEDSYIQSTGVDTDGPSPFGGDDIYEDISLILNGKPKDFDPLNSDELLVMSDDDKKDMLALFEELPIALDVILYNGTFEPGFYKTKWYDRNWVKYIPKAK